MQWTNVTSADYCKPKNWMVEANLTLRHKSCVDKVPTFDVNYCRAGEEKSTRIQLHGKVEMHVWGESHPLWRKTWASSRLVLGRQQYIEKWTTGVKGSLQSWIPVDALFLSPNSVQNFPWPRKRIGPPLVSSPPIQASLLLLLLWQLSISWVQYCMPCMGLVWSRDLAIIWV